MTFGAGAVEAVNSKVSAVYYARSDYASFLRRLLAAAIDATVILALATATSTDILMLSDMVHPVHVPGGDRPDLRHCIIRSVSLAVSLSVLGPIDFLWIFSGPFRQTLHDNFAQTFVVKVNAKPLGRAKVTFGIYEIFLWNLTLPEIRPDD